MSHSAPPAVSASELLEDAPAPSVVADIRVALELLLELGTRILDGDTSALLGVAPALAIAMERLDEIHRSLRERAQSASTPFFAVLAEHAEHRRRSDLRELDVLGACVNEAEAPSGIGRSIVVAALVLLSNLESDERWCQRLTSPGELAEAA